MTSSTEGQVENDAAENPSVASRDHESLTPRPLVVGAIITLLVLFATARVCFVAASYPVFCHLDELAHVDTVYKYADGRWPSLERECYDDHTIALFQIYNSPEWILPPDHPEMARYKNGIPANYPKATQDKILEAGASARKGIKNHEAFQPPVYYLLAGMWWHLGKAMGLDNFHGVYWIRFLGGVFLGLLVLTSYRFLRAVCPERPFLWFGVPTLIAFLPQDVFAFVNNDVAAPWMFPLCLELLYRMQKSGASQFRQALIGLLIAGALLVKPTNLTLLFASACLFLPYLLRNIRGGEARLWNSYRGLWLGAGIPLIAWAIYAAIYMGEITGTYHKVGLLGFMPQSWENFVRHPFFTLQGLWIYFEYLLPGFWRGDLFWHDEVSRIPAMDVLYSATTVLFLSASLFAVVRRSGPNPIPGSIRSACWIAIISGVATLMILSVSWDFGQNTYPSRDFPYFSNGRLLASLIMPLMLLYLDGMERLLQPIGGAKLVWAGFAALIITMAATEIATIAEAFASPWNLWHLETP